MNDDKRRGRRLTPEIMALIDPYYKAAEKARLIIQDSERRALTIIDTSRKSMSFP